MNHSRPAAPTSLASPDIRGPGAPPVEGHAEGDPPREAPALQPSASAGDPAAQEAELDAHLSVTDPIAMSQIRDALKQLSRERGTQPHVLLIIHHRHGAETVRLHEGVGVVVGRDPTADVAIPERSLSRRHARFTFQRGDVLVEDLGSTNGTFLSGQRVERGVLKPGDEVALGEITASLRVIASAELPVLNLDVLDAPPVGSERRKLPSVDDLMGGPTPVGGMRAVNDEGLVMRSPAMRPVLETAMRLARSSAPVLVQGETGTGKDVLARLIHEAGPRHKKQMIRVGCSGVPAQLLEITLFGREADALHGDTRAQEGVFEACAGGTVVLDEVGDLPPALQAALLRLIDTGRVARVGSTREIAVDVRIVATTYRDLEAMCEAGSFRSDLLYRLNAVPLRVPPLCERREDIAPLAQRFLRQANEVHRRNVRSLDPETLALLEQYPWPGNVRELRSAIERAVVTARGNVITPLDLPESIQAAPALRRSTPPPPDRPLPEAATPGSGPMIGLKAQMDRLEAEIILDALRATNGNLAMAARRLRMPLRTLQEKIASHGLRRSDYRDGPPSRSK
ncbi:Fis family transcriptional regulator [Sorangium cellulosum]|uniref:Fis family transcriptional regulator n=1 Tax=Sorangium cellulosum TaxID=56 RepID=A0A150PFR1_SORCE|nr:Fis family transcriptional regulator [Sorangium cellulosum]